MSGAVRIVHNKVLGGWYVVRGPHQFPLGGKFNSKQEAKQWLRDQQTRRDTKTVQRNPHSFTSTEARELTLYITNDGQLYRQTTQPIIANLKRKMAKKTYDTSRALKAWLHLANAGAMKYNREHGSPDVPWHQVFPMAIRREVARELADYYDEELTETNPRKRRKRHIGPRLSKEQQRLRRERKWLKERDALPPDWKPQKWKYETVIAPYSLKTNEVGIPTAKPTVISKHTSLTSARNRLGSLISGKRRDIVRAVVPQGDGFKIFVREIETGKQISRAGNVIA